jgi:hypothetical protein
LAIATSAVYGPVTSHPFANYDDQKYVTGNPHVQAGLTRETFTWALFSIEHSNWHPVTWLSHALDCQLFGLDAGDHHLTNLLLHVCNVLLLFLLALRVTNRLGRSLLLAALFALHPFNVESVAWIAERKNVLSMLFFLLALGAYGWYAQKPNVRRYLAIAVTFALGLAAKPMVITLPFVLLLLDFWPFQRFRQWAPAPLLPDPKVPDSKATKHRKVRPVDFNAETQFSAAPASFSWLILEKLPLLALSLASAVITVIAQRAGAALQGNYPLGVRLENAAWAYAMYVWKTFWPSKLAIFYPHPGDTLGPGQVALAVIFLTGVSFLVWKFRMSQRYLVTGWLWFLGTLVPVIGLVQVGDQAMADRYMYLPIVGIFLMIVWGAGAIADHEKIGPDLRVATSLIVLVALSIVTWRQIGYWRDNDELWSHAAEVTENNYFALLMVGRADEALPILEKAVVKAPRLPMTHVRLANTFSLVGRQQDAAREYTSALALTADPKIQSRIYEGLATAYTQLEDFAKVRESYQNALRVDPRLGPEMVQRLSVVVDAQPTPMGCTQLGILLQENGNLTGARAAYEQALQLDPNYAYPEQSLALMTHGGK